jgi:hypothetical protein
MFNTLTGGNNVEEAQDPKKNWPVLYAEFSKIVRAPNGFEVVQVTDSIGLFVHVLHQNPAHDEAVFISQYLPAMVTADNPTSSDMLTILAGRYDRKGSPKDFAQSEALEEAGISLGTENQIEFMYFGKPLALSPGILTERMHLAYVAIDSSQLAPDRVFGAEHEGERIKRHLILMAALPAMEFYDMKTVAAVQWVLRNKIRDGRKEK